MYTKVINSLTLFMHINKVFCVSVACTNANFLRLQYRCLLLSFKMKWHLY